MKYVENLGSPHEGMNRGVKLVDLVVDSRAYQEGQYYKGHRFEHGSQYYEGGRKRWEELGRRPGRKSV